PDLRGATLEACLAARPDLDPAAAQVLRARLAASRIAAAKLGRGLAARDDDGRLRDLLVYHKAHTGRWAGRLVQPHNLPQPHEDLGELRPLLGAAAGPAAFRALLPPGVGVADGVAALVRPCFRAAAGKVLLVLDFAGVEARGVAWCAGEAGLLGQFAAGGDA